MRFTNLEIVKLLRPRLGFGSPELRLEHEARLHPPPLRAAEPMPETDLEGGDDTQLSLLRLADELERALQSAPVATRLRASESLREVATLFTSNEARRQATYLATEPEVIRVEPVCPSPPRSLMGLEGCKVAAIGFGRQDMAGLATALIDRRARIEFLPRGEISQLGEFDLLLLSAASGDMMKPEARLFRETLALGIPSIVIGSRSALTVLRESTDSFTWDFASKPIHIEELIWRAVGLISRQLIAGTTRRLPARVVVADEDPFTRALIESALAQLGVQCQVSEEGETAWNLITESQPGVVILDLTLPNRDGFQLMADIRRITGRKPKIIVLSARQSEADILRSFSLGADDYITKPFSPLELTARLSRLLGGLPEHG